MKKLLFLSLLVSMILTGKGLFNEVDAVSMNFDYGNISPRFQYLEDDEGVLIPFEFEVFEEFVNKRDIENIDIRLQQVTYGGRVVRTLHNFTTDYVNSDSYINTPSFTIPLANVGGMFIINLTYNIPDFDYEYIDKVTIAGNIIDPDYYFTSESEEYLYILDTAYVVDDEVKVYYAHELENTYVSQLQYDWSDINWFYKVLLDYEDIIFYRVVYNELVLITGAVMQTPERELTYDVANVEFGTFLVWDDGEHDPYEFDDYTSYLNKDDYWILHYRIPQTVIDASEYININITDINTATSEDTFTTNNITSLQGCNTEDCLNSFILIPLDQEISRGLQTSDDVFNDVFDPFFYEYEEGSFFIAMTDPFDAGAYLSSATVVWNIMTTSYKPFELGLYKSELSLGDKQRVVFYKNSTLISSSYTTIEAYDYDIDFNFADTLNLTDLDYSITYEHDVDMEEEEVGFFYWELEPIYVPYSLTESDYPIKMLEYYTITEPLTIDGHLENWLIYYAFDTVVGGAIFSAFVLLFVNLLLLMVTREMFVYAFVNIVVVLFLSFTGLIPLWLIIGMFMLGIIGFKLSMSGGSSYE